MLYCAQTEKRLKIVKLLLLQQDLKPVKLLLCVILSNMERYNGVLFHIPQELNVSD